jgi:hypothetical protein
VDESDEMPQSRSVWSDLSDARGLINCENESERCVSYLRRGGQRRRHT